MDRLREDGHTVRTLDRLHGQDIRNPEHCHAAIKDAECVVHLAGILGTDELFDAIDLAIAINIQGTANVLAACHAAGASYVGISMLPVFASIYTATKIAAHRLASAYHHTFGMPVCHVRAFNAYGAGQANGRHHPRKIIPSFACEAWRGDPLTIYGDGVQTVDLIHADAIAEVFAAAVHVGDDSVIDAGTGVALTVNGVARLVLATTGSMAGIRYLPMRRGEIPTQVVATGEGWEHLSHKPEYEPEKLAETIRAYQGHPTAQRA